MEFAGGGEAGRLLGEAWGGIVVGFEDEDAGVDQALNSCAQGGFADLFAEPAVCEFLDDFTDVGAFDQEVEDDADLHVQADVLQGEAGREDLLRQ